MTHHFKTWLRWHDSTGAELEAQVWVTYSRHKGHPGDRIDPPEPDSVDIDAITDVDDPEQSIPKNFYDDDCLLQECFEHWNNDEIEAAEWREQSRRDALMEGF